MIALLGGGLGIGFLLVASPWLWPADRSRARAPKGPNALVSRATELLEAAGYAQVAPRVLGAVMAGCALTAAAVAWLVTTAGALALLAGVAAAWAPLVWLRSRAARLVRVRRAVWPDVCDLLVGSVRAGLSLPDAVAVLGDSAPSAVRPAFAQFDRDVRASGHFASSLDRLKQQLSDPMADRIVEAKP